MRLDVRIRQALARFRRRRAQRRAVQEFRRSLALVLDGEALEASFATRLKEIFDPDRLAILQLDPRAARFRVSFSAGFREGDLGEVELPVRGRLARWFLTNETCLLLPDDQAVLDYLEPPEREQLSRLEVQLYAPLLAQSHLVGMVLLGTSRRDRLPSRADAELLKALADQASLAFQNATFYREQQERLEKLHRADRLAAIGQLAAGVAHEVRNPLTAIRSTIQYLGRGFDENDPKQKLAQELIEEVDRIDATISSLLSLTRAREFEPRETDLAELLEQTVRLLEAQVRKRSVQIEERYHPRPLRLWADPSQLKQVFLNVLLNALQAIGDGGRIRVTAELVYPSAVAGAPAPAVNVRIVDEGPGIPPEQLQRIFDPFFTTKAEGTGLGLSICQNIIQRHNGEMEIRSKVGEGTEVSIFLPVSR